MTICCNPHTRNSPTGLANSPLLSPDPLLLHYLTPMPFLSAEACRALDQQHDGPAPRCRYVRRQAGKKRRGKGRLVLVFEFPSLLISSAFLSFVFPPQLRKAFWIISHRSLLIVQSVLYSGFIPDATQHAGEGTAVRGEGRAGQKPGHAALSARKSAHQGVCGVEPCTQMTGGSNF